MIAPDERSRHEQTWLLLPWLASGRLAAGERERVEDHVSNCVDCERELVLQQHICNAFAEPDRVTYAPGPSFRKLLERIDRTADDDVGADVAPEARPATSERLRELGAARHWRPPGLAWAASFILVVGITGLIATGYRWAQPVYATHTETAVSSSVLHIALDRSLTIGEVEEMLRADGARIVEGNTGGVLGIEPIDVLNGKMPVAHARRQLRNLAARLRADSRVLWVEPVAEDAASDEAAGTLVR